MNRSAIAEVMYLFSSPLNPPMPPPLCFGDAREGTVRDLSSRARRGTTPLAKHSWLLRSATRSAAWSTPPGSNIKLSARTNPANQNMWKLPYLEPYIPMKRNPEQNVQSPAMELGCIWIESLAIRKDTWGHNKVYSFDPGGSIKNPRRAAAACSFGQSEDCTIAIVGLRISIK